MSILHNGQQYGAVQVINYSAALDYNRGVEITNIQDGTYIAPDNGYILITLKSEQSNPTKVSVLRNKEPITDVGEEIASRILQQYQYSETLTVNVLARDYYKLFIEGAGNPKILKCMFYPFASTVPMKLIDTITPEQVEGVLPVDKGGTGTNNAFNFQNFFDYMLIGKPNATIQEFWDGLPRDFFGATYITEDTIRGLGSEYGILFFGKALNRRYLKFVEFSGNFGIYNEYVLIDNASKSNITFSDFIHTTLNSYPKRAYPFSGIRRYSSEFRTANEIHKLKMGIGDILSVNNTGSAEFLWNMDTRFPEGGQYYVDFYRVYINANNKIDRKWCGIYSGSASIGGSYDPNICFIGNIIKIS